MHTAQWAPRALARSKTARSTGISVMYPAHRRVLVGKRLQSHAGQVKIGYLE
jgi:hypothetical protein